MLLAAPLAGVAAQENGQSVARGESAFVVQAPAREAVSEEAVNADRTQPEDASSKVYFPDQITPQSVAAARANVAQQQQLELEAASNGPVAQVSNTGEGVGEVDQLSNEDAAAALAQLSSAEQQVLLEAVDGTDICDHSDNIPAIQALCDGRIETRSAEFAQGSGTTSAEETILGEGLESQRAATLEAAIARLAENNGDSNDFSNQVIASVALGSVAGLSDGQTTSGETDPASDLTPETQAVINAIVQQLGGN